MKKHSTKRMPTTASLGALIIGLASMANAQTLTHRYSFSDSSGSGIFTDSVGSADGTINNSTAINADSASLDGSQLQLDGTGGYAQLPSGLLSSNTQVTIEMWVSCGDVPTWTRVFSFGDQNGSGGEDTGVDFCPYAPGNYQNLNYQTAAGGAYANNPTSLNNTTNMHVTVVLDPVNNTMYYYNGSVAVSTLNGSVPPLSGLIDTYGLIGRSLFDVDPTLTGSIDEFRIYSGVLPRSVVALNDAAGPDNVVTNPGTILALHFNSPANPLLINQVSQQTLVGDFANVTGLDLIAYGGATFTSLNPSVVSISTNGVVKALAVGSAQVVASYGGLSATNSLTVVSLPPVLAHRYSFASDAADSIGGANGSLQGTAAVSGGQLVLDGSFGCYLDLPADKINLSTNSAVTFDVWATFGDPSTWAELFAFGNTNSGNGINNIACVPCAEAGGFRNWGLTENFANNGRTPSWSHGWNNLTAHITCVLDPTTGTMSIYRDGVLEIAEYDAIAPLSNIATNYAFIGRSMFDADPYLIASVDEFRIYNGALTPAQVALNQQGGPSSTNLDVGALSSIVVVATNYPAHASLVPPVVLANYANLPNFNLLPTVTAGGNANLSGPQGLVVTSSDSTIVSVNAQNMLTTYRAGSVTLTASYGGKTSSATVQVRNEATLTHRYSFNVDGDSSDSVGGANATLQGAATITGGQLQLTGADSDYLDLPTGLLTNYDAVTIDAWVNFGDAQNWARLWEFADIGAAIQNEFYFSPGWNPNPPNGNYYNAGFPWGGNIFVSGALGNAALHITCEYGNGWLEVYTNGVLEGSVANLIAPASSAGINSATIGHSPYNDPGINGSVDEFRIYNGLLAPDEIVASDLLGPDQTLSTTAATLQAAFSSGNIVLSWPLANAGFSVQMSSSLGTPNWVTLTNTPVPAGNTTWETSVPATGGTQFFRLWR